MNRRAFLTAAAVTGLVSCATALRRDFALAADLDIAIARAMALNAAPGLALAVYTREGGFVRGVGITDIGTGERASTATAFYIASSRRRVAASITPTKATTSPPR